MKNTFKYLIITAMLFGVNSFNHVLAQTASLNPNLDCDIQLNQVSYTSGDTVTVEVFRIANHEVAQIATELKIWLGVPDTSPLAVTNVGSDGGLILPSGTDLDLGPFPLLSVTTALPSGSYEFSCRMLDPITGELLAEDRNGFFIPGKIYSIGSTGPAGGTVFYITAGGLHGLEAAPADFVASWGCESTLIAGADGTAIGTGAQNTADILAGCAEPDIGAALSDAYSLNGFSDWFLPSINELRELYLSRGVVGGFASDLYLSSSEQTIGSAGGVLIWRFDTGSADGTNKNIVGGVRAVRAF